MVSGCNKTLSSSSSAASPTLSSPPAVESPANLAKRIAGGVEKVSVQVTAQGPTLQSAVDAAIRLAIEQVNGKTMDASSESFQAGFVATVGGGNVDVGSAGFASYVETHSKGAISGFRILTQRALPDNGGIEATIAAKVAKYVAPESSNRLAIVVAPFRANGSYVVDTQAQDGRSLAANLRAAITAALVKSNRFTVLDREFSGEIDQELGQIADGQAGPEAFSRLGQQIAAQYLLIGQIDEFNYARHEQALRTSDRTLVSHSGGGAITLKLVNVTTRQIDWTDTVSIRLPSTDPTTLGGGVNVSEIRAGLLGKLGTQAMGKVVTHLFPITVVSLSGDKAILSQGESAVVVGTTYRVVSLGADLKDPQTGQSLGQVEEDCCLATITQVTPTIAYARLSGGELAAISGRFTPGKLQLRETALKVAEEETKPIAKQESSDAAKGAAQAPAQVAKKGGKSPSIKKAASPTESADQDKNW